MSPDAETLGTMSDLDPADSTTWPQFMTISEVAQVLRTSVYTVERMVAAGTLESMRPSPRLIRIPKSALLGCHAPPDAPPEE